MPNSKSIATRFFLLLSALISISPISSIAATTQPSTPVAEGVAGKRAFDDLLAYYREENKRIDLDLVFRNLSSKDAAVRSTAAAYLLALFQQSFADETNGRATWKNVPWWGGGSELPAREFRVATAKAFGELAYPPAEALEPAMWLIESDRLADCQAAGIKVLRGIESPNVIPALRRLISPPHPNRIVLVAAIEDAGRRGAKELAEPVAALCGSYRETVRNAATAQANALGIAAPKPFDPRASFTPALEADVKSILAMVLTPIPPDAAWKKFTVTTPPYRKGGEPEVNDFGGWILKETDDAYLVLDLFADATTLLKSRTKITDQTLAEAAADLAERRKNMDEDRGGSLSRRGGLTAQFEARAVSLPEALLGAWAFQRGGPDGKGDRALAASILFPRYSEVIDERWIREIVRDLLGKQYHQLMLDTFSRQRDYPATIRFAQHLSRPEFDGYDYQDRAKELAAQLAKRGDDFHAFRLPRPDDWAKQKASMSRAQEVEFLAERLRLLNCFQWSQPGGVNFDDTQTELAQSETNYKEKATEVINPYVELNAMKLQVIDLPALVPFLTDLNFMPTYSYWRDFHPSRNLYRANSIVASMINTVSKRNLADMGSFSALDEAGKQQHLAKIMDWIKANQDKSGDDLLMETLTTTSDDRTLEHTAMELAGNHYKAAVPVLIRRFAEFPEKSSKIIEICCNLDPGAVVNDARTWANDPKLDAASHLWAGLILLRSGNRDQLEGLKEIREVLESAKTAEDYFPVAFDALLATKNDAALQLACEIFHIPSQRGLGEYNMAAMTHRLLLLGRQEALDYVTTALDDTSPEGTISGTYQGKQASQKLVAGDAATQAIAAWRSDIYDYESLAPDEERAKEREKLKAWITEQFKLIREGKESLLRTDPNPLGPSEWRLDAPP